MQAQCFLSLNDFTKPSLPTIANGFTELGFTIVATTGTANLLKMEGILVERVLKLHEGRPHAGDMMANGKIQLMVITNSGNIGTTGKYWFWSLSQQLKQINIFKIGRAHV